MKFMLLVYTNESTDPRPGQPGHQDLWDAYVAIDDALRAAGALIESEPLAASPSARTIEVRNGIENSRPGPATRGELQLTGYYLLECASLDEAASWAARIPGAATGCVEVRPLLDGS